LRARWFATSSSASVLFIFTTAALHARADASTDVCGAPATPLHAVQGSSASSPLAGRSDVVVEGVVVGNFPGFPDGLGGFFLQEEDSDADADPLTSEGLFVFSASGGVQVGDTVRVRGEVREFFGLTELGRVDLVKRCAPRGVASPARVLLPVDGVEDWERWEGMLVRIEQELVATGASDLGRFGELWLAAGGRLWEPTQRVAPGDPARAWRDRNLRRRILLDDGSHARNPDPTPHLVTARETALRLGDRLPLLEGVLDFAFGEFRIHPTAPARFEAVAERPEPPRTPPGALRVAGWNVENFFNGDGLGGGFPTRGAASARELERQRAKLALTLAALDADVVALVELENDGVGPRSAARELAGALSDRIGAPIEIVDPGEGELGEQPIAVGLFYRSDRVEPIGAPAVLDARADPSFDSTRNRPSLAHSFVHRATGERVTVAVNHWKSKGSPCDAAGDPDLGDGQGSCNRTRTFAASALAAWLATDPTGAGDPPVLIVGDLNAHPHEDPVAALIAAGFTDLLGTFAGPDAYSYVFDGAAGRLDHALASAELLPFALDAEVWHTNADETPLLDYHVENPPDLYAVDPYRASDHDPVLVALFPDSDGDGVTDARDACQRTALTATVVLHGCDSGVPESLDAEGCSVGDRLQELSAGAAHRGAVASATSRWLAQRVARGLLSPRERAAILACVVTRPAAARQSPRRADPRRPARAATARAGARSRRWCRCARGCAGSARRSRRAERGRDNSGCRRRPRRPSRPPCRAPRRGSER